MNLLNENLNEVVIASDSRDIIETRGQQMFCEAYANGDFSLMISLLSKNIGWNLKMKNIFTDLMKKDSFEILDIIECCSKHKNYNYREESILDFMLNEIALSNEYIERNSFKELILETILRDIKFDELSDHTLVSCIKNTTVSKYLNTLIDRGLDFSNYCILQLSSRDGDDCFISEATNGLDDTYRVISSEILSREECECIYLSLINNPRLNINLATLYPEEFICEYNDDDNADYIGFTFDEIRDLKEKGIKFYSFRGDDKYLKYFTVM